jgi:hypothetical protein
MKTKSIGFIGGGRITKIFLVAYKNAAVTFDHVRILRAVHGSPLPKNQTLT